MYKFRYSNLSTIVLMVLMVVCLGFLTFAYIGCAEDGYSNVEILTLSVLTLLFGGLAFAVLFMIGNYAGAKIILKSNGIEKRTLFGKKIFVEWNNIVKIENGNAPDYLTGYKEGYIIRFNKDEKERKIIIMKNKKIVEAFERIVPKELFK